MGRRRRQTSNAMSCQGCKQVFLGPQELQKHLLQSLRCRTKISKTNPKPKRGKTVEESPKTKSSPIHTSKNAFKCEHPNCVEVFSTLVLMKQHQRKSHTNEKRKSEKDKGKEKLFSCKKCKNTFSSSARLHAHSIQCQRSSEYSTCNVCGSMFITQKGLMIHQKKVHGHGVKSPDFRVGISTRLDVQNTDQKLTTFTCYFCEESRTSWQDMLTHKKQCRENQLEVIPAKKDGKMTINYKCKLCLEFYPDFQALRHHVKVEHLKDRFKCEHCNTQIFFENNYIDHLKSCLKSSCSSNLSSIELSPVKESKNITKKLIEQKPNKKHDELKEVKVDQKLILPVAIETKSNKDKSIDSDDGARSDITLNSSDDDSSSLRFNCKICSKKFSLKFALSQHMKRKHNKTVEKSETFTVAPMEALPCEICKDLVPPQLLPIHSKRKHDMELFRCRFCNIMFNSIQGIKVHIHMIHRETPSHANYQGATDHLPTQRSDSIHKSCRFCLCPIEDKFLDDESWFNHMLNVHPQKCLTCPECWKKIISEEMFIRHIENKHPKQAKDLLGSFFNKAEQVNTDSSASEYEEKVSTKEKCSQCDFVTNSKFSLQNHISSKHPEKLICPQCQRSFKNVYWYSKHISRCPGLEKVKCSSCDYVCKSVAELNSHALQKHKKYRAVVKAKLLDESKITEICTGENKDSKTDKSEKEDAIIVIPDSPVKEPNTISSDDCIIILDSAKESKVSEEDSLLSSQSSLSDSTLTENSADESMESSVDENLLSSDSENQSHKSSSGYNSQKTDGEKLQSIKIMEMQSTSAGNSPVPKSWLKKSRPKVTKNKKFVKVESKNSSKPEIKHKTLDVKSKIDNGDSTKSKKNNKNDHKDDINNKKEPNKASNSSTNVLKRSYVFSDDSSNSSFLISDSDSDFYPRSRQTNNGRRSAKKQIWTYKSKRRNHSLLKTRKNEKTVLNDKKPDTKSEMVLKLADMSKSKSKLSNTSLTDGTNPSTSLNNIVPLLENDQQKSKSDESGDANVFSTFNKQLNNDQGKSEVKEIKSSSKNESSKNNISKVKRKKERASRGSKFKRTLSRNRNGLRSGKDRNIFAILNNTGTGIEITKSKPSVVSKNRYHCKKCDKFFKNLCGFTNHNRFFHQDNRKELIAKAAKNKPLKKQSKSAMRNAVAIPGSKKRGVLRQKKIMTNKQTGSDTGTETTSIDDNSCNVDLSSSVSDNGTQNLSSLTDVDKNLSSYYCKICCKSEKSYQSFRLHNALYHDKEEIAEEKSLPISTDSTILTNKKIIPKTKGTIPNSTGSIPKNKVAMTNNRSTVPNNKDIVPKNKGPITTLNAAVRRPSKDKIAEKMLPCFNCGIKFKTAGRLKLHLNSVHSYYECEYCFSSFNHKRFYVIHKRVHAKKNAGKAYKCEECDRSFSMRTAFNMHKKFHKNPKGVPHDSSESDNEDLKRYNSVFKSENTFPFLCGVCNLGFVWLSDLISHSSRGNCLPMAREESDAIVYPCKFCNQNFFQKSFLKFHIAHFHGNQTTV